MDATPWRVHRLVYMVYVSTFIWDSTTYIDSVARDGGSTPPTDRAGVAKCHAEATFYHFHIPYLMPIKVYIILSIQAIIPPNRSAGSRARGIRECTVKTIKTDAP